MAGIYQISCSPTQLLYKPVKWCYFSGMNALKTLTEAMRLKAWTKNFFVFAALLFGKLWTMSAFLETLAAAVGFGLVSSAIYLINDTVDRKKDRLHPEKKNRPVASGRLSPGTALVWASFIGAGTLAVAWVLAPWLALVYTVYFLKQIAYSLKLKNIVILDCILILNYEFKKITLKLTLIGMLLSVKMYQITVVVFTHQRLIHTDTVIMELSIQVVLFIVTYLYLFQLYQIQTLATWKIQTKMVHLM